MSAIGPFSGEYRFLSNFWPAQVQYEGLLFPTSEHAYQAAKVTSPYTRRQIRNLDNPGLAKKVGQTLTLCSDWEGIRVGVMATILERKFRDNGELGQMLLDTGQRQIIELNHWHDTFWGACSCAKHGGRGRNVLGQLLMAVRSSMEGEMVADENIFDLGLDS